MKHVSDWGGVTVFDVATHDVLPRVMESINDRDSTRAFTDQSILDAFAASIVSYASCRISSQHWTEDSHTCLRLCSFVGG